MNIEALREIAVQGSTPSFIFDADEFSARADKIKNALGDIPLCFSIKANPFLLYCLPESVSRVEVCSPGELEICKNLRISPSMIIYSGVNKGSEDIESAIEYNASVLTAESRRHVELINKAALKLGRRVDVILRLSNGNQFGMDPCDIEAVISSADEFKGLNIIGLHYYTGTQKKKSSVIEKDIAAFADFIESLGAKHGFHCAHVEYGPGIAVEYFNPPFDEKDCELLSLTAELLKPLAEKYNVTVEMGRFLASSCGTYITSVADLKTNCGTNYAICDGGINHLNYYGQTMALQVPPITVLGKTEPVKSYTLCGSLCTTADLLVRKVELPELEIGDVLAFGRCGAYSVTEGIGLFLSRTLPRIFIYSEREGAVLVRDFFKTDTLNTPKRGISNQ